MMGLSYVHGLGTLPLISETVGGCLRSAAERFGDREALVSRHQGVRLSYNDL